MWLWVIIGIGAVIAFIMVTTNNRIKAKDERKFQMHLRSVVYDLRRFLEIQNKLITNKVINLKKYNYLIEVTDYEKYITQAGAEVYVHAVLLEKLMVERWSSSISKDNKEIKQIREKLFGDNAWKMELDEDDFVLLMVLGRDEDASVAFTEVWNL
ncbi:hypothetical protein NSS79_09380 [Paenibacillus sp. FSL L8-0436]|uniref:hypothetical protein n=1 Tax=Paenibacillus sp. FSL L8-0436 TaxID=2954686 RepID=UPI003159435D